MDTEIIEITAENDDEKTKKVVNNVDDDSSMEVTIGKEENVKVESSAVTTNAPGKEDNPIDKYEYSI